MVAWNYTTPGQHEWAAAMKYHELTSLHQAFWAAAWPHDFQNRSWFVNRQKQELERVYPATNTIANYEFTLNWTGRMVQPFICFNPLERK